MDNGRWTTRYMVEVTYPGQAGADALRTHKLIQELFKMTATQLADDRTDMEIATWSTHEPLMADAASKTSLLGMHPGEAEKIVATMDSLCDDQGCQFRNQPLGRHPAVLGDIIGRFADGTLVKPQVHHPRRDSPTQYPRAQEKPPTPEGQEPGA